MDKAGLRMRQECLRSYGLHSKCSWGWAVGGSVAVARPEIFLSAVRQVYKITAKVSSKFY
jgi:hypothetical protein